MSNLFDAIDKTDQFKKYTVDDLMLVEYTCDPLDTRVDIWSHRHYFTYVVNGKMDLITNGRPYTITAGKAYFIRKGAFVVPEFFDEVFCDLIIFMSDQFMKSVLIKHEIELTPTNQHTSAEEAIIPLQLDQNLEQYYRSLFVLIEQPGGPSDALLKLKLEELIIHILHEHPNEDLHNYFASTFQKSQLCLQEVMEENFCHPLKIHEYARLCAKSSSSFYREFLKIYGIPPKEWIRNRRLEHGAYLLNQTNHSIAEVADQVGFKSRSYFNKVFKNKFGLTPFKYRNKKTEKSANLTE